MTTFDEVLPKLTEIFKSDLEGLAKISPVLVNRDLNGRVRLILDAQHEVNPEKQRIIQRLGQTIAQELTPHAFQAAHGFLFETDLALRLQAEDSRFKLTYPDQDENGEGVIKAFHDVFVVDRLLTETSWTDISEESSGHAKRLVFFSIKGGVGRSTALAVSAWALAEQGNRVLVLDLDLESPGLSSSFLPDDYRPKYGIADWLLEDLVNNGEAVFDDMAASSPISHNGAVFVVPAHGREPGEYLAKLGRAWMPIIKLDGTREIWSHRLLRLIEALEAKYQADFVLIDSRAGIDEISSACITDLGAHLVLLFALDGSQTWQGYRILFDHWLRAGVTEKIRERLQMVCALIPETERETYRQKMLESSWSIFSESFYEEVGPGKTETEDGVWSYDLSDPMAPHAPWPIDWHRSFYVLPSLHDRLIGISPDDGDKAFGKFLENLLNLTSKELK